MDQQGTIKASVYFYAAFAQNTVHKMNMPVQPYVTSLKLVNHIAVELGVAFYI
jgi:hypothetical protein